MDSDNGSMRPATARLFGRERPIHTVLGGGKVADVLLWRDIRVSGAVLMGIAAIWYLFEVVEYNFLTLLSHLSIIAMLVLFLWYRLADFFDWSPPNPFIIILEDPNYFLQESTSRDIAIHIASTFHRIFHDFLAMFLFIASGFMPDLFLLTIVSLWIISVIGNSISILNLLFFGFVCLETLPFLYERYEEGVDILAYRVNCWMKKMYQKFKAAFLVKIPKGPIKDKKY